MSAAPQPVANVPHPPSLKSMANGSAVALTCDSVRAPHDKHTAAESEERGERCLSHYKNDSGSYDGAASDLSKSSGSVTTSQKNTGAQPQPAAVPTSDKTVEGPPSHTLSPPLSPPPRSTSAASMHSEEHGSTAYSSSSSLSHDLSQASSNSREMISQQVAGLYSTLSASSEGGTVSSEDVKQLLEHVVTLKLELEELRLENAKLKDMRTEMDDELHTLTENLFEEAYKMVDSAKEEKGSAVKKLADAAGKIDAMETEMSALKNLLQVPPPTSKSPSQKHHKPLVKKAWKKLSRKMKAPSKPPPSVAGKPLSLLEHKNEIKGANLKEGEMMPSEFSEFREWLSEISRSDHPYLLKVEETDVKPCLDFKNKELSSSVLVAARRNDLVMESLGPCSEEEKRVCALSSCEGICCTHRMQLGTSCEWLFISQPCRDRIAAVCDFYMYLGHIEKGILKLEASQLYWQVSRLRAMMALNRLTLHLPDSE